MLVEDLKNELYKRDIMTFSKHYPQCYEQLGYTSIITLLTKDYLARKATENLFLPSSIIGYYYKEHYKDPAFVYLIPHCSIFNYPTLKKHNGRSIFNNRRISNCKV